MELLIIPIWFQSITIISEHTPPSNLLAKFQSDTDAETIINDQEDSCKRTALARVTKCVAILLNTEAFLSVTTSSAGIIYMGPYGDLVQNLMFVLTSGIVSGLSHVLTKTRVENFSKEPTTTPKRTVHWRQNGPTGNYFSPVPSPDHPPKSEEGSLSLSQTRHRRQLRRKIVMRRSKDRKVSRPSMIIN